MLEHFLDPYPDEILYSVWARYSDDVRHPYKHDVSLELFGKRNIFPLIDLPCHLRYFVDNLPLGHDYTIEYLMENHTLLPLYRPFMAQERLELLQELMRGSNGTGIHQRVGIGSDGVLSSPWLRYCVVCVEEDRKQWGECYWHRLHQVPGVEICPTHSIFLENSTIPAKSIHQIIGIVSAESVLKDTASRSAVDSPFFSTFMDVALDAQDLLSSTFETQNIDSLSSHYRALAAQQGFMTSTGSKRLKKLLSACIDHYTCDLLILLDCELKLTGPLDSQWLATMISLDTSKYSRRFHHPLRHILALRFLGSTVKAFFLQDASPPAPFGSGPWPCLNSICEMYQQKVILAYQVARTLSKDITRGKFACPICGYIYSRWGPDSSPSDVFRKGYIISYGELWDTKLREMWFDPALRLKDIAHSLGVFCSPTIRRQARRLHLPTPRQIPLLVQQEISTPDVGQKRSGYRSQWLAVQERMTPEASRSVVRSEVPGVYGWLFRHDRAWLEENSPKSRKWKEKSIPAPSQQEIWALDVEQKRSGYRSQWLAVQERMTPEASRSVVRSEVPGVYRWLLRHDRAWLEENSPKSRKWKEKSILAPSINKRERIMSRDEDIFMSKALRTGASKVKRFDEKGYPIRVSVRRIFKEVLQGRWIPAYDQAPLTAKAIKEVTETFEAFAVRRIQWILQQFLEERRCPTREGFLHKITIRPKILHDPIVQHALNDALNTLSQFT